MALTQLDINSANIDIVLKGLLLKIADLGRTDVGAVSAVTGLKVTESGAGGLHRTRLTLSAMPMTLVDANVAGAQKLYTFPEGRILLLGALSSLAPTTTSAIASTLNSGVLVSHSLGSVTAAADGTLTSTEADMLPSANWTSSTVINVAAAAVTNKLAASAQFDGTATAIAAFLNAAVPTATDIDADATITVAGYIDLTWIRLGDY